MGGLHSKDDEKLFGYLVDKDVEKVEKVLQVLWEQEDTNKSHFLEKREALHFFERVYNYLKEKVSFQNNKEELVNAWFQSFDKNKDEKISLQEFKESLVKLIKNPPLSIDALNHKKEHYHILVMFKINLVDLPSLDHFGQSDPVVQVSTRINGNMDIKHTETIKDNDNPEFYPGFTYMPKAPLDDFLFCIGDADLFGKKESIGTFKIPGDQIFSKFSSKNNNEDHTEEEDIPQDFLIEGDIILSNKAAEVVRRDKKHPRYRVLFKHQTWEVNYGADKNEKICMSDFNKLFYNGAVKTKPPPIRGDKVDPPKIRQKPKYINFSDQIKIVANDQTFPDVGIIPSSFTSLLCDIDSNQDQDRNRWRDRSQGIETIGRLMGRYLPLAPEGEWDNVTEDSTLTRFFFQGIGATRTFKLPDGKGFCADFDDFLQYEVLPGFARYQGKIFFDPKGTVTHIGYQNQIIKPGDNEWEHLKFLVRSTALITVTANEHLTLAHLIWSNLTTGASTTYLSPDHPIRRLLHIHTYRASYVNQKAFNILIPDGGALLRVAAWPYPELQKLLNDCYVKYKYETFAQSLKRMGMDNVDPKLYPYGQDGQDYWNIIHAYVNSYIHLYYPTEEKLRCDKEIPEFWTHYSASFPGGLPELNLTNFAEVLTQFIFFVSGMHNQVGNVAPYARDPAFAAGCVGVSEVLAYPQFCYTQAIITIATAGELPLMIDNWSHLMPNEETKNVWKNFHEELVRLSHTINERNNSRQIYNIFNPDFIATSVAV